MNGNYIFVYLDGKTYEILERTLKEKGMSRSGLVRRALMNEFKRMGLVE